MLIKRIFLLLLMKYCLCDNQTIFTINGKKSVHVVSDKFLSVSVDPAVLLSGLNISTSLTLSSNLNPAYIRIAGPSSKFLQFTEDETKYQTSDESQFLRVTPTQWNALNEWFTNANLIPVFGISEKEKFDSKSIFLLLDMADKINASCFWQLGFDSSKKQLIQYVEEIKSLKSALNAFPRKAKSWKIVGSDISALQGQQSSESLRKMLEELEDLADTVMWESKQSEDLFPQDDVMTKLLSTTTKPHLPIWTTAPKSRRAVSFATGILWGRQIGDAASKGFNVIFRQPRLYEFFIDTPVYWISVIHKQLMGINVLDVKANDSDKNDVNVYAHCTRRQNDFSRRGAATIFIVSNASLEHNIALKIIGATELKTIEVQAYTLTFDGPESANTYLNGQKLTREVSLENRIVFTPKIHRMKLNKYLTLDISPKSVNFFVLPDARVQTCINNEHETEILMEEIHADRKLNLFSGLPTKMSSRFREEKEEDFPLVTLNQLYSEMQKELDDDGKFYNVTPKRLRQGYDWMRQKSNHLVKVTPKVDDDEYNPKYTKSNDLEDEIKKESVLTKNLSVTRKYVDRLGKVPNALVRHDKLHKKLNGDFTSEELDEVILTAIKVIKGESFGVFKSKRECKGGGRGGHGRGRGSKGHSKQTQIIQKTTPKPRPKRAINMELLRQKADEGYMIGKSEKPSKLEDIIKIRESDLALEMKRQRDKMKADLDKLLHPEKAIDEQKFQSLTFNTLEKMKNEKSDIAADAKKQYETIKADLEKILHPAGTPKNDQKLQTRVLDSEEDYFNESNDLDGFSEEFKLGKPLEQHTNEELWNERFHKKFGNNMKLQNGPNNLLDREFILDTKDSRDVEKTIKNLEDYFNRAASSRYQLDDDPSSEYDYDMDDLSYQKPPLRFKRDDKHYTEADIQYYRQLMLHNIKHMRDSMRKQKMENLKLTKNVLPIKKIKSKHVVNAKAPRPLLRPNILSSLKPRANVDRINSPVGYDSNYNNASTNLENKKNENSVKYLRNRLAQPKRIDDARDGTRLKNSGPEVNEETQRLINLIKSELRKKRRSRSVSSAKLDTKVEEEKKSDITGCLKNVRAKRFIDFNGNCMGNDLFGDGRNDKNGWSPEDGAEIPSCTINNASRDLHTKPIENKNKLKGKEENQHFVNDIVIFFSKLFYKLFANS